MKTDIDIKDDLYNCIKSSKLAKEVTGVVTKRIRPANSENEDIVISVISSQNGQIQEAFVNVNIYVQDVLVTYEQDEHDTIEQYEENAIRLRKLAKLSAELFDSINGDSFIVTLDSQRILEVNSTNEHVINNRLLYRQLN